MSDLDIGLFIDTYKKKSRPNYFNFNDLETKIINLNCIKTSKTQAR